MSRAQHALWGWSGRYLDLAVSTAILRLWPLVLIAGLAVLRKRLNTDTGADISKTQAVMMIGAAVCGSVAVAAQGSGGPVLNYAIGSALGAGSAILAAVGPVAMVVLAADWRARLGRGEKRVRVDGYIVSGHRSSWRHSGCIS